MTTPSSIPEPAEIIVPDTVCTLDEICLACHVDADWVAGLV